MAAATDLPAGFPTAPGPAPMSGDFLMALPVAQRKKALEKQVNFSPIKKQGESHVLRHASVPFDKPLPERPDPLTVS